MILLVLGLIAYFVVGFVVVVFIIAHVDGIEWYDESSAMNPELWLFWLAWPVLLVFVLFYVVGAYVMRIDPIGRTVRWMKRRKAKTTSK